MLKAASSISVGLWIVLSAATCPAAEVPADACLGAIEKLITNHSFTTTRTIINYAQGFPETFTDDLVKLRRGQHWVDMGSGDGLAALSLFAKYRKHPSKDFTDDSSRSLHKWFESLERVAPQDKPRVTALSYRREQAAEAPPYLSIPDETEVPVRFLSGRFFNDIPPAEIGAADLITDFYGILAYAPNPDEVLRRYYKLLKPGGKMYLYLGERHGFGVESKVELPSGTTMTFKDWLSTIKGDAKVEIANGRKLAVDQLTYSVVITKTKSKGMWDVPRLELRHSETDTPPRFSWKQK